MSDAPRVTRPSIAALQRAITVPSREDGDAPTCQACHSPFVVPPDLETSALCHPCAHAFVADTGPVLLEIAAAAKKWLGSDDDDRASELEALIIALDKVRR